MARAAYVHIPFCEHICHYCDFNKYFLNGQPVDDYLTSLAIEMTNALRRYPSEGIETVYIGGGTPTALNEVQFSRLLHGIRERLAPSRGISEFTVEANPENLTKTKLTTMKEAGVNRISLGVQSFEDSLLAAVGRPHTEKHVHDAIELISEAGFDNVSIDLMFRLPGQTREQLASTLETALSYGTKHISIYSLQVEPRTVFYNRLKKGRLPLPDEDAEAEMYEQIIETLGSRGLRQYEISNFAVPGYESRHNTMYWQNEDYYGFGAGAHGYLKNVRRVNAGWTKKYIRLIKEKGDAFVEESRVSLREQMGDHLFLGLRMADGVSRTGFFRRFGVRAEEVFGGELETLAGRKWIEVADDRIFLTKKGLFLGNEVFQAFV
ncbi:MAG TPA: radical SAM family heme chaperone HemW [Bacillales bacterium]|nr:radical SAM family heme chaperone HemW [Bacillales bacterium]